MGKKPTIEFIRESFETEGYTLLSNGYINNKQKLEYICPKGHRHSITWNCWDRGQRCPCFSKKAKKTIEFIHSKFEKENYKLLTKEYIGAHQKLDYICPKGCKRSISWFGWRQGQRCICFSNNKQPTIDFICAEFKKEDYILLTKRYVNNRQKLEYVCNRGHNHNISWRNWISNRRCPYCFYEDMSKMRHGKNNPNWEGGISKEPYCQDWNKELKDFVKGRDGYKCINPDCWGEDGVLTVHHIDYNKKACGAENLVTVCRSCNSRANTDRNWHKAWYRSILNKRYHYVY